MEHNNSNICINIFTLFDVNLNFSNVKYHKIINLSLYSIQKLISINNINCLKYFIIAY